MKQHRFNTKNTVLKNAVITKAGIYRYRGSDIIGDNIDNNKTYRVLKSQELIKSLVDKAKMIPITDGHKGDVIIKDSIGGTIATNAPIGVTGSQATYNEQDGSLTVDLRILKDKYETLKQSNKLSVSIGATGSNIYQQGVDPVFGAYDAIQTIDGLSHLAIVKQPRVKGSYIYDENETDIDNYETYFTSINDETDKGIKMSEEVKTETVNEPVETVETNQPSAETVNVKVVTPQLSEQPTLTENVDNNTLMALLKEMQSKIENMETSQAEKVEQVLKDREEQDKKINELIAEAKTHVGEISKDNAQSLSSVSKIIAKSLGLVDSSYEYVKGYLNAYNKNNNTIRKTVSIADSQDNHDDFNVKLSKLLKRK